MYMQRCTCLESLPVCDAKLAWFITCRSCDNLYLHVLLCIVVLPDWAVHTDQPMGVSVCTLCVSKPWSSMSMLVRVCPINLQYIAWHNPTGDVLQGYLFSRESKLGQCLVRETSVHMSFLWSGKQAACLETQHTPLGFAAHNAVYAF
jgi:hypothetical protein